MADLVTMYHPGIPGDEDIIRERSVYRNAFYPKGWRSDDDPGYTGTVDVDHYDPGTELFCSFKSDATFATQSLNPVPITGWSGSAVAPGQPFRVEACVAVFSSEVAVSASARASNVVTLTVPTGHGLVAGDPVQVRVTDVTFNGNFVLTGATATTVTYAQTAADDASGGAGQVAGLLMPRAGGVLSLWADIPVSAASRTTNQVTLTVPQGHGIKVGADVIVDLTDGTFDQAASVAVNQVTATTIRVPQTAANDPDGGTGTVSVRIGQRHEYRISDLARPFARVPCPQWEPDPGLPFTIVPRLNALNAATGTTAITGWFFGEYHGVLTATVA